MVEGARFEDYDDVIVSKNEAYDAFKFDQSPKFIVLLFGLMLIPLCCVMVVASICSFGILYIYMDKKENETNHNQV